MILKFFIFLTFTANADNTVVASVSEDKVKTGSIFEYKITIEYQRNPLITEPEVNIKNNLSLVRKNRKTLSSATIINGKLTEKKSHVFVYLLKTLNEGEVIIPRSSVIVDGKKYFTEPITITVSDNFKKSKPKGFFGFPFEDKSVFNFFENNIDDNHIFLLATTDKKEAYLGEKIRANFYIYSKYDIRNPAHIKHPILENFWKEDVSISTNLDFKFEQYNGQTYKKALLFSYDLFPLKEGSLVIDSYEGRFTTHFTSHTRSTKPINIKVKPLPTEGRPFSFMNAVGSYNIHLKRILKQNKINTPFNYTIVIEGSGNTKQIELNKIKFPELVEVYDLIETSKYDLHDLDKSNKVFDYLLLAKKHGNLMLPQIEFSFFDPENEKYFTKILPEVEILITKSENNESQNLDVMQDFSDDFELETSLSSKFIDDKFIYLILIFSFVSFLIFNYFSLSNNKNLALLDEKMQLFKNAKSKKPMDIVYISVLALEIIKIVLQKFTGTRSDNFLDILNDLPVTKKHLKNELLSVIKYFERLAFSKQKTFDKNEFQKHTNYLSGILKSIT